MPQKQRVCVKKLTGYQFTAIALGLVFVVCLTPLLLLCVYSRPFGDDFSFGWQLRTLIREGGGFLSLVRASIMNVVRYYNGWQGSFSTVLIASIHPGILNAKHYFFTTLIMLGALIFSVFFLLRSRVLALSRTEALLIGFPVLWLSIQYLPDAREAFFWYNGAVMYTFSFGISLVWLRLLTVIFAGGQPAHGVEGADDAGSASGVSGVSGASSAIGASSARGAFGASGVSCARGAFALILCALIGIFLGGTNYVTALLSVLISIITFLLSIILKKSKGVKVRLLVLAALTSVSLMVSLLAPGNAVRAMVRQPGEPQMEIVPAVLASFGQAARDIYHWTDWRILIITLALVPVFARIAARGRYNFRYPALILAASLCLFSAQYAPHFYATSWEGPGRLRDIIYFSYIWLFIGNVFYMTGSFVKSARFGTVATRCAAVLMKLVPVLAAIFVCLFIFTDNSNMTAKRCADDIRSGLAAKYAAQIDSRIALLESSSGEDVILEPLSTLNDEAPLLLSVPNSDLSGDTSYWSNAAWAHYFGLSSVRTQTSAE